MLLLGLIWILMRTSFATNVNVPPRSYFTKNGFLASNESFVFTFDCGTWPEDGNDCTIVKTAVESAGVIIANDILFRVPVTIHVKMRMQPNSDTWRPYVRYPNVSRVNQYRKF